MAIHVLTGEKQAGSCACTARQAQMNQWGIMECFRQRRVIAGWLIEEAQKRGYIVTRRQALLAFGRLLKKHS